MVTGIGLHTTCTLSTLSWLAIGYQIGDLQELVLPTVSKPTASSITSTTSSNYTAGLMVGWGG